MTLSKTPGVLKRFRRTPWRFQRTFQTPLKNLEPFVTTIISAVDGIDSASLTVDKVVFEPKHIIALLTRYYLPPEYGREWCIQATAQHEPQDLLQAALSDWLDFFFIPTPKPFIIFADHDEFTTFYANSRSNLNRVVAALLAQKFQEIEHFEREFQT